jgi:hypothetical protein
LEGCGQGTIEEQSQHFLGRTEESQENISQDSKCPNRDSVPKPFASCLLPKNIKISIYKTIILPLVLYGCETSSLALRKEYRLMVDFIGY